ncbi:MAG: aminoglycoside phosphotransferase family protein [Paenibacillus sp.]|uniref:aminoglycoside phosphotransferase family protein n=1 Tax=Paenibacillus sp. TaxID=58172 RepID=UPI0025DEBCF6|nr:aminoglycoside phosphotransferase family protein [Paenibacillus sp.]MBR2566930.1 aminoglycoside phosphotransferase family protein [Paenibacillus sp.]
MRHGELIGMGNTANVYLWGNTEVIKIFHDHESSFFEANKEAKNAEIINNLNLRAPSYSGTLEYEGKLCLIYERIDGQTMLLQITPTVSSITHYAKQMAQLQYEMHQVKIGIQPNLKNELLYRISSHELINEDEKQRIKDILDQLPENNTICHYDFHPGNIILSSKGPIIIDWLNALVGHEAADVARSSMMLQSHALPPNAPEILIRREYRELFHQEYLREYLILSGKKDEEIKEWMAPTFAYRIGEMNGLDQIEMLTSLQILLTK